MTSRLSTKDLELIAAFIDRRLSTGERAAFLERLDAEPALYEVFVDTVRSQETASTEVGEIRRAPTRRPWTGPASIAALLALALATPLLFRGLQDRSYAQRLAASGRLAPYLSAGWFEPSWSVTRGVRPGASESDSAFRLGVHIVDLEIALRTDKAADARILTRRLEALLGEIPLSQLYQASYATLRQQIEAEEDREELLELARSTDELVREHIADHRAEHELGRFCEAGRLAARSGHRDLLASRSFARRLQVLRAESWSEEVEMQLEIVAQLTAVPVDELRLASLEEAFTAVIREG